MKKLPFILIGLAAVIFVGLAVTFGINPKAKPVIKPSNFDAYSEVGKTLYRQLYQQLGPYDVVAFGIDPNIGTDNGTGIISSVIEHSRSIGNRPFDVVVQIGKEPIKNLPEGTDLINVGSDGREAGRILKRVTDEKKRALLVAGAWDVPHFHFENLIHFLEKDLGKRIISFAKTEFYFDLDKARSLQQECTENNRENTQFGHLSCLGYKKSRWMRRNEKVARDRKVVILERQGEFDYVMYLYEPES